MSSLIKLISNSNKNKLTAKQVKSKVLITVEHARVRVGTNKVLARVTLSDVRGPCTITLASLPGQPI